MWKSSAILSIQHHSYFVVKYKPITKGIHQKYRFMPLLSIQFAFLLFLSSCFQPKTPETPPVVLKPALNDNPYGHIQSIPLPSGYTRLPTEKNSFAAWLRQVPLKRNKSVYTYNGQLKINQQVQFAVLDISVGNKDLQQCADAVMRLRAEYLYSHKQYGAIDFIDNENTHYKFTGPFNREAFDKYLQKVFAYCGSLSLSRQLKTVSDFKHIQAGDVLISGGSPGHAMLVMDVATNEKGNKIYLLSQSYMPAQDIHLVINPADKNLSPWYEVNNRELIETPEWTFTINQLKRWPAY